MPVNAARKPASDHHLHPRGIFCLRPPASRSQTSGQSSLGVFSNIAHCFRWNPRPPSKHDAIMSSAEYGPTYRAIETLEISTYCACQSSPIMAANMADEPNWLLTQRHLVPLNPTWGDFFNCHRFFWRHRRCRRVSMGQRLSGAHPTHY